VPKTGPNILKKLKLFFPSSELNYWQWRTREFFPGEGGGQKIQLRREGRENGDLGAVFPASGVPLNLQMSETRFLIRLLRMYFPPNWEFFSALSKFWNFGGGGGGG
jgi:hypothetical protein